MEDNPFALANDEEVFRLRDEERKRRQKERIAERKLPVWKKGVKPALTKQVIPSQEVPVSKTVRQARELVASVANERRQEKENMAEFIAKKREMFLVQMSLDTKREEIRKLEEKAQMKEEALKKSEQMLEEDAIRFDTFLKENDKKAHEAIKRAERETKMKNEKVQEIKRLNQQIQLVTSDMSKHKETLEDCLKYKAFLDSLTPQDWFEEQKRVKTERQQERRALRVARNKAKKEADDSETASRTSSRGRATPPQQKKRSRVAPSPKCDLENEDLESSGDELPMYFTKPQQLLDIFTQLEEQNLFLIQNCQETEEALEELKQNFEATQNDMEGKTKLLKQNIADLEAQIDAEDLKAAQLRSRLAATAGEASGTQEKVLAMLHDKVKDVYQKCGFDVTSHPSTLVMLSELEAKLEMLLDHVAAMPDEYIIKEEKDKEKKRRERKRAEQQALQDALQEERNRKSIARSLQAPKKRTGRQVMFRSPPIHKTRRAQKQENNHDDLDEIKYLSWDNPPVTYK